ncbi:hypothetical protein DCS_07797 [Drechmeria coniospora]|uniref:Uncharacterized protein n=1 Tax=Drechmeria coniospora TaxID=98403 RepID=A0A151GFF5_DRECN|nr:hypothetical protein DCS_07797 [Drechmeria coniospora]KYK55833.1 hypothetical protein DCS_07797 [Drechmeria coniospora]
MCDARPSDRRQYLLSSLNQDRPVKDRSGRRSRSRSSSRSRDDRSSHRRRRRSTVTRDASPTRGEPDGKHADTLQPRPTRLKLKKDGQRRRHRHRSSDPDAVREDAQVEGDVRDSHRRHRHGRRRRRRSPTPTNIHEAAPLDPDAAFRESLFDAMADDDAAMYWEHVYGQPIHVYAKDKVGPQGELERMTDEEYSAYVRQKMFEKTHAGLLEEKARREEARSRREKESHERRKAQEECERRDGAIREEMERSLRRGQQRRERKAWAELWDKYTSAWAGWDGSPPNLPWPNKSGRMGIDEQHVRTFFTQGLNLAEVGEGAFEAKLKEERVRWHPDKIQQRLGGQVDDDIMRDVTAIFQIIDRLWRELRADKG